MSEYPSPRRALPSAPHWTIPTPWPQPRPSMTAVPPEVDSENHTEGTVWGSGLPLSWLIPGYRAGSRQGPQESRSLRNSETVRVLVVPDPETTTFEPESLTRDTGPAPQSPASRRNRPTSD